MAGPLRQTHCLILAIFASMISGCTVGPDFVRPVAPVSTTYTVPNAAPKLAAGTGEPAQRLVVSREIPSAWWQLFHSPALDSLVRQAIAGSPTIEAAQARLAQAQQSVKEAQGAFYPQLDAAALAERQRGVAFALGLLHPPVGPHV